ncbi:hypothetical protein XENOCAPTIV_013552 [Xenoophorus captivus]|uniref:Uncharacterized protein n=1 Tax=Xenoophorus captivus TaxID=1517983 RepID=A0ABV0SC59_9TELE
MENEWKSIQSPCNVCVCVLKLTCTTAYSTREKHPKSRQAISQISMAFTYETFGSSEAKDMLSLDRERTDKIPGNEQTETCILSVQGKYPFNNVALQQIFQENDQGRKTLTPLTLSFHNIIYQTRKTLTNDSIPTV